MSALEALGIFLLVALPLHWIVQRQFAKLSEETVTFMGLLYRFDHIADARRRELTATRELYLDPGLIYVTD